MRLQDETGPVISLMSGSLTAQLAPHIGGGLIGMSKDGRNVIRQGDISQANPVDLACFPMAPYANRIRDGQFQFEGREIKLDNAQSHALHGIGWIRPWSVDEMRADRVILSLAHDGDKDKAIWPWAFIARLHYDLTPECLVITLSFTNNDVGVMPFGLGLHPYFRRTSALQIQAESQGVWLNDADLLPVSLRPRPFSYFDHEDNCHTGFGGVVKLDYGDGSKVRMQASNNCQFLHIYAPPSEDYICFEPTTHHPDSFNDPHAPITVLQPGQTAEIRLTITPETT